jgi:hypothetical protein
MLKTKKRQIQDLTTVDRDRDRDRDREQDTFKVLTRHI